MRLTGICSCNQPDSADRFGRAKPRQEVHGAIVSGGSEEENERPEAEEDSIVFNMDRKKARTNVAWAERAVDVEGGGNVLVLGAGRGRLHIRLSHRTSC
jgi:hypothetical protein